MEEILIPLRGIGLMLKSGATGSELNTITVFADSCTGVWRFG